MMITELHDSPTPMTMDNPRQAARLIGAIMLAQLFAGPIVNFALMGRVEAAPGFLANAASHATDVSLAVVIALAMALFSLGTVALIWPILRRHSPTMALLILALGIANFSTEVAEQTASMSMLSLSQKFAAATADANLLQAVGDAVGAAHKWAHFMNLIVGGVSASVLYAALLCFALIPRVLAGLGVVAALLLLYAVITPLFGQTVNFTLLAPMGLAQLAVSLWLMARGFTNAGDDRPGPPLSGH